MGENRYTEYHAGDLPVILSAPHGGRERPESIPDRADGTFSFDTNTQELARAIAAEFQERTGRPLHVVICRLHRRKLDCNREIEEGAAGQPAAKQAWNEYHGFLDSARAAVIEKFGRGLYLDLHGHGHKNQRLELGYLHSARTLAQPDDALNKPEIVAESSLRGLAAKSKTPYAELIRGPLSFGALLESQGFTSTPSPREPIPATPYFNGGYSTVRHARMAGPICGLQIETNYKGVRDTSASRQKFAAATYTVVAKFLQAHLDLQMPTR